MSDFETQRRNMVDSQIRPADITDRRLIRAMLEVPREAFVPAAMRQLAYMDGHLTVVPAEGSRPARVLLAPMVLAKLIQLADVQTGDVVLDVGCASGYSTAILARLAESVVGLECDAALAERAGRTLAELGVDNAAVVSGPLEVGCPEHGPFQVIVMNGAVAEAPEQLREQLVEGGRLVTIISEPEHGGGGGGVGRATLFERIGKGWSRRPAFDASAPILPGFIPTTTFVF